MELCYVAATPIPTAANRLSPHRTKPSLPLRSSRRTPLLHTRRALTLRFHPRHGVPGARSLRASEFDEASHTTSLKEPVEIVKESSDEKAFVEKEATGIEHGEAVAGATVIEQAEVVVDASAEVKNEVLDLLKNLDLNLDTGDVFPILSYGGGGFVALWVASAIVGALDALPLIPKILEIIGLGYTVWFTYRYLVFKKNRDELSVKVQELKEQIIGHPD